MAPYTPLSAAAAEIRLLDLVPGEFNTPISCILRIVSLDDEPKFEALSYVWGEEKSKNPITVDGRPTEITANLEAALRALRHTDTLRTLWIDAICINQEDVGEKNIQLPLMGKIYTGASRVLAWMGPSNPDIELTISWFQTYVWKEHTEASQFWLNLDEAAKSDLKATLAKECAIYRASKGYADIWTSPYWARMWTCQEYSLPAEEPICLVGRDLSFQAVHYAEIMENYRLRTMRPLWPSTKGGSNGLQELT